MHLLHAYVSLALPRLMAFSQTSSEVVRSRSDDTPALHIIHMRVIPEVIAALVGAPLYLVVKLGITAHPWSKPPATPGTDVPV